VPGRVGPRSSSQREDADAPAAQPGRTTLVAQHYNNEVERNPPLFAGEVKWEDIPPDEYGPGRESRARSRSRRRERTARGESDGSRSARSRREAALMRQGVADAVKWPAGTVVRVQQSFDFDLLHRFWSSHGHPVRASIVLDAELG
jgi:hypothetical protein